MANAVFVESLTVLEQEYRAYELKLVSRLLCWIEPVQTQIEWIFIVPNSFETVSFSPWFSEELSVENFIVWVAYILVSGNSTRQFCFITLCTIIISFFVVIVLLWLYKSYVAWQKFVLTLSNTLNFWVLWSCNVTFDVYKTISFWFNVQPHLLINFYLNSPVYVKRKQEKLIMFRATELSVQTVGYFDFKTRHNHEIFL